MRHLTTALLLGFLVVFAGFDASAQMSKKEKKEWKKRIKALSPEQYKSLLDENSSLKDQIKGLQTEANGVEDRIAEKDEQISDYQSQLASLRSELESAKSQAASAQRKPSSGPGTIDDQNGVVFKVQIGAFEKKDLAQYDQGGEFKAEEADGLKKYTLGVFKDYWEADTFKKYLREMGVKEAWIVSYKDGQRVPIKDVLEGVI
ncbi:MAG: Ezrin/radixin/moesin family protein [Cyclobacteriaceae bacterium]